MRCTISKYRGQLALACALAQAGIQTGQLGGGLPFQLQALFGQPGLQGQVLAAFHIAGNEVCGVIASCLQNQRWHGVLRDAVWLALIELAPIAFPHQEHDIVQTLGLLGMAANAQVQTQCNQGALAVVADQCVGRVFVLLVVTSPGVKRALCGGLLEAARASFNRIDVLGQQLEVIGLAQHARA